MKEIGAGIVKGKYAVIMEELDVGIVKEIDAGIVKEIDAGIVKKKMQE